MLLSVQPLLEEKKKNLKASLGKVHLHKSVKKV